MGERRKGEAERAREARTADVGNRPETEFYSTSEGTPYGPCKECRITLGIDRYAGRKGAHRRALRAIGGPDASRSAAEKPRGGNAEVAPILWIAITGSEGLDRLSVISVASTRSSPA